MYMHISNKPKKLTKKKKKTDRHTTQAERLMNHCDISPPLPSYTIKEAAYLQHLHSCFTTLGLAKTGSCLQIPEFVLSVSLPCLSTSLSNPFLHPSSFSFFFVSITFLSSIFSLSLPFFSSTSRSLGFLFSFPLSPLSLYLPPFLPLSLPPLLPSPLSLPSYPSPSLTSFCSPILPSPSLSLPFMLHTLPTVSPRPNHLIFTQPTAGWANNSFTPIYIRV